MHKTNLPRRAVIAGLAASALAAPHAARAAGLGGLTGLLAQASDATLDKLAQPGAFYNDKAIRILLPLVGGGLGKSLGSVLEFGDKLGLTSHITRSLNDAAGLAAKEAKPVFRSAIDGLSLADVPGIVSQNDGASRYLRQSAGQTLQTRLRPLIDTALGQVGAFNQLDALSRQSSLLGLAGLNHDRLGASVTEQAMNGIFKYLGDEETRLRANPLGAAGNLLKGVFR